LRFFVLQFGLTRDCVLFLPHLPLSLFAHKGVAWSSFTCFGCFSPLSGFSLDFFAAKFLLFYGIDTYTPLHFPLTTSPFFWPLVLFWLAKVSQFVPGHFCVRGNLLFFPPARSLFSLYFALRSNRFAWLLCVTATLPKLDEPKTNPPSFPLDASGAPFVFLLGQSPDASFFYQLPPDPNANALRFPNPVPFFCTAAWSFFGAFGLNTVTLPLSAKIHSFFIAFVAGCFFFRVGRSIFFVVSALFSPYPLLLLRRTLSELNPGTVRFVGAFSFTDPFTHAQLV